MSLDHAERAELNTLLKRALRAYTHTVHRGESTERYQEKHFAPAKIILDGFVPDLEYFAPYSRQAQAMLEKVNKRLAELDAERDA